jgi:predicted membrane channel-forming protein YqfA (hemolysin III family)
MLTIFHENSFINEIMMRNNRSETIKIMILIKGGYLLLLLIMCYNLFKVLACSTTFFHLSVFRATFFQLCMLMLFIPSKTPSYQCLLRLPIGLLDMVSIS